MPSTFGGNPLEVNQMEGYQIPNQSMRPQWLTQQENKREGAWNQEEHRNFLRGLYKCGWGNWKLVAQNYVRTRTQWQIVSHAQKYQLRYYETEKKRRSIHDTTLEDEHGNLLPLPVPPWPTVKDTAPAVLLPPNGQLPQNLQGALNQLELDEVVRKHVEVLLSDYSIDEIEININDFLPPDDLLLNPSYLFSSFFFAFPELGPCEFHTD
ncbi:probable transcription factor At5g61620 [Punica granatum]|nr:probable transcription factor At5g61620 [Punica granatum]